MKALITGASEGIGRSFAVKLAKQGFSLTLVARNAARLQELINELGGKSHQSIIADLSTRDGIEKVSKKLTDEKFDLLVNNAGFGIYTPFRQTPLAELEKMRALNCDAVIALTHAFLGTAKHGDSVINVSSTASYLPMPVASLYQGTKELITGWTESLWYEEQARGVYVQALCPGITRTQFHTRAGGADEDLPTWMTQTPEQVVDLSLKALKDRRQPIVICGPQKPMIFFAKFLPRKWVILFSGKALSRAKRS